MSGTSNSNRLDGVKSTVDLSSFLRRLSIRWRLTIYYSLSMCLLLACFGVMVWFMTRATLLHQADRELNEELADLMSDIEASTDASQVASNAARWSQTHDIYDLDCEIRTSEGILVFQSRRLVTHDVSLRAIDGSPAQTVVSGELPGLGPVRIKSVESGNGQWQIDVATSLARPHQLMRQLALILLSVGIFLTIAAGAGGYFLSRRTLRPVAEIARTASRISANRLDERIGITAPLDELGELAQTLNSMLDRINQSFMSLERFTADAAHELRTPLTLLRNELEVGLRSPRTPDDYKKILENALSDTIRMCDLAEQLLELTRGDAERHPLADDPVPVAALLNDVVSQLALTAQERNIAIDIDERLIHSSPDHDTGIEDPDDATIVSGDCKLLQRLFVNLLDNALKYSAPRGRIGIAAETDSNHVHITISDSGCGIPAEHLPHVFERFYRTDCSRSSLTGGCGLGLSICRSIVEAHEGTIEIVSTHGEGTQVRVALPTQTTARVTVHGNSLVVNDNHASTDDRDHFPSDRPAVHVRSQ